MRAVSSLVFLTIFMVYVLGFLAPAFQGVEIDLANGLLAAVLSVPAVACLGCFVALFRLSYRAES